MNARSRFPLSPIQNLNLSANRLAGEKSPYLLQHAHNPVDWYPWGDEAFAKAKAEIKPIFLSIGYSTCHWCHVMERESFEDPEIAVYLREHFVSIKVDREERPDVDATYMAAVQAMSGSGGWPMTVFLTPDLKPFFAGTYFPPRPAHGRASFRQLLERIDELWSTDRESLMDSAEHLLQAILPENVVEPEAAITRALLDKTYQHFEQAFDPAEGGFGGAPKFPRPVQYDFLFHYFASYGIDKARDMALFTLRKMALGGMNDHLGGGFHRYSVDRYWRVSHFEKMLYDQAQLVESYLDAYQITGDPLFRSVVKDTIEYVLRDLRHPDGAFYCAEDADSEGEEGKFYAWSVAEVRQILAAEADAFVAYYGLTEAGNFEHATNVLHVAEQSGANEKLFVDARRKLMEVRSQRIRPHLDDKVLTSWNGLMIGAISRAADVLDNLEWANAARNAAEFIWSRVRPNGKLLHRWREDDARFNAYLDDYAFLIKGFLELYEATFQIQWIARAIELQEELDQELFDDADGAYFMSRQSQDILVRSKSDYDGAEPSGNSVAALNLFRLAQFTGDERYRERAERVVRYGVSKVGKYPYAMPEMMAAAHWMLVPPTQVVLAGIEISDLKAVANKGYLPLAVQIHASTSKAEFAKTLQPVNGKAAAYVCHDFRCELPVTEPEALALLLKQN